MAEESSSLLFQSDRDYQFALRLNKEYYARIFKPIEVWVFDKRTKDPLYGEAPSKSFNQGKPDATSAVPMWVEEIPYPEGTLTRHGQDEQNPLVMWAHADAWTEYNLRDLIDGDHIEVVGWRYKVMGVDPQDWFGNTQVPLSYRVTAIRERPESVNTLPRQQGIDFYPPAPFSEPSSAYPEGQRWIDPATELSENAVDTDGGQLGELDLGKDEMGSK